jgi:uncharacterized phiE125 gp8 family phage protein
MLKLYSAVQTELLTVTELKSHIHLDSSSISSNITVNQCITGGYHAITAGLTGTGADVLGNTALVILESYANSAGATLDCKIQESDDNATYTDWTGGTFTQVTTANDTAVQQIEYTGTKQYINVYVSVAGGQSNFAVNIQEVAPYSTEDTYAEYLIKAAREYAQEVQHRAIGSQVWELIMDDFPVCRDYIELPLPPLISVTQVNYIDTDGTSASFTAGSSGYYVDADSEPGKVFLAYGITWPAASLYPHNGVVIRFTAGYTASTLPIKTRQAMLMYAGLLYKYRDSAIPEADLNTVNALLYGDRMGGMVG